MRSSAKFVLLLFLALFLSFPVTGCDIGGSSGSSTDNDDDGFPKGKDCNDNNADIHPDAIEIPNDGIDQDCDGSDSSSYYKDADGDGYGNANDSSIASTQPDGYVVNDDDCNDDDADIDPYAAELCDGVDQNCNGQIDESCTSYYYDSDGDGYGDPNNTTSGMTQPDGYVTNSEDCDDLDATVNPAAVELCDGIDQDCDGQADEGCISYYLDADGDGYGDSGAAVTAATPPAGYVSNGDDCDDANADINPAAAETCDGLDNNCDGLIDDTCLKVPEDYLTIQAAIDSAPTNSIIYVNDGTYYESIDFKGKSITIQSINGAAGAAIDGSGSATVVIFGAGESSSTVLDGFTITNGDTAFAGGIYISGSSPTIKNCIISNNSANTGSGGGVYSISNSSPTFENCTISNNTAAASGGGIYSDNSTLTLTSSTISNNTADEHGGGIYIDSKPLSMTSTTISDNTANWGGGAIFGNDSTITASYSDISNNVANSAGGAFYTNNSTVTIASSSIADNSVNSSGGGGFWMNGSGGAVYSDASTWTITNSVIDGNSAVGGGGGIVCDWSSQLNFTNCIITNNAANYGGFFFLYWYSSSTIKNCTISNNSATTEGGAIYCSYESLTIVNSILWGDTAAANNEISPSPNGTVDITYSDIDGGWTATGNINADPLFSASGNYRLGAGSPCIDAGTATGAPADDIDGDTRPQGSGIDMGADEYAQ